MRNELATAGKVRTMACFVYAGDRKEDGSTSPTIKTVSLSWKTEFQKELIRKRIRDKAVLEKASAVLVVADAEMGPADARPNGSSQRNTHAGAPARTSMKITGPHHALGIAYL